MTIGHQISTRVKSGTKQTGNGLALPEQAPQKPKGPSANLKIQETGKVSPNSSLNKGNSHFSRITAPANSLLDQEKESPSQRIKEKEELSGATKEKNDLNPNDLNAPSNPRLPGSIENNSISKVFFKQSKIPIDSGALQQETISINHTITKGPTLKSGPQSRVPAKLPSSKVPGPTGREERVSSNSKETRLSSPKGKTADQKESIDKKAVSYLVFDRTVMQKYISAVGDPKTQPKKQPVKSSPKYLVKGAGYSFKPGPQ